ncbi:MAG TPA: cytochrome c oxidase subunit 3 [Gemmatimonadaceae bacterium]|jgi:heme/copper-type cytochrome/quinol oxidase subunit 3
MATAAVPAHAGHPPTTTGLDHRKVAIWAFIGSECMLFISLISTYLIYKGRSVVGPFPHEWWCSTTKTIGFCAGETAAHHTAASMKPILNIPVTSMSTFVLLMSSLFMVLALEAVENKGNPKYANSIRGSSRFWLMATAIAGATFLGFQAYEFTSFVHEGLSIRRNLFGSTFFTLTGFHGAHVTAGVLWLLTMFAIDSKRGLTTKDALLIDICALYWHFVDVVWIAIFTLIYLIK